MAQHAAQARPATPVSPGGTSRWSRVRSAAAVTGGSQGRAGEVGERNRAARTARAGDQVVAAGIERRAEGAGDGPQIVDLRFDLGEFVGRVGPEARIRAATVRVAARVAKV